MSTELSIATERGQSMADLMGVTTASGGSSSGPDIARIGMIHTPLMGEVEMDGKMLKIEVLPIGTYKIAQGNDVVYATELKLRIFAMRQQWTRWNSETEDMEKTVLANNLNGDLQDNRGGFNLGRPSGYIKDFQALPESTKAIIRSVKRTKVLFGTVSSSQVFDKSGNPVDAVVDVPFIYDLKNLQSIKNVEGALNKFKGLPIMTEVVLTPAEGSIPTGAKFGFVEARLGDRREIEGDDEDTLRNFLDVIEHMNGKILDKYYELNNGALSPEDAALVADIIDNDFVDVDE